MNDEYNFTQKAREGKWGVFIDPVAERGYFEHDDFGEGGGLWFDGQELIDYDGVWALRAEVATAIRSLGYDVDKACEA